MEQYCIVYECIVSRDSTCAMYRRNSQTLSKIIQPIATVGQIFTILLSANNSFIRLFPRNKKNSVII